MSPRNLLHEAFPEVDADDPSGYFTELGDAAQALMYSWLFWPRLLEAHGAVFVALWDTDETEIPARLSRAVGDDQPDWPDTSWQEAVDSFNYFEVPYLFRHDRGSPELQEEVWRALGAVLVRTWTARLASEYPERRFAVSLVEPDDSISLRIKVTQELVAPPGWSPRCRAVIGPDGEPVPAVAVIRRTYPD